jgi:hypothetical protein
MVDGKPRRLWRNSPADAILLGICIAQFAGTIALAALTPDGLWPRLGSAILVTAMMTYSLIVVSHLFVHQPWFTDDRLNALSGLRRGASPARGDALGLQAAIGWRAGHGCDGDTVKTCLRGSAGFCEWRGHW